MDAARPQTGSGGATGATATPSPMPDTRQSIAPGEWRIIFGVWAVLALLMVVYALAKPAGIPLFGDNAMRMVMVQDLLNGQSWQDLTQYRDNVPNGASMHWSRLIDAPIALLVMLVQPVAGNQALEIAALLWPMLLVLPMLVLCVQMSRRLVPGCDLVTALALPIVSIVLIVEFLPGRVDHHNVQMLLTMLTATALLVGRHQVTGAVIAGAASATSLAIGMETLPFVAVTITAYALLWLFQPAQTSRPLAWFGLSLAVATALHFIAATPPALYLVPACDMLSIAYVVPILAGGAALASVAWVGRSTSNLWHRTVMLGVAGAATLAVFGGLFPDCLKGPYAMEELLAIPGYFEEILEAQSLATAFAENWANATLYVAAALVGFAITLWRAIVEKGERRVDWLILLGFIGAAVAILWLQLRGIRFAALFALPAAVWLVTQAQTVYRRRGGAGAAGLLVGAWLLVSGAAHFGLLTSIAWLMPGAVDYANVMAEELEAKQECIEKDSFAALAALPAGVVMANFNLGTNLLLFTPHSIVSSGFHRNVSGTTDVVNFLSGDEETALAISEARAIDYVVTCPRAEEYSGRIGPTNDTHWAWLTPLSDPAEPLQIYQVER